ncbi:C6 zinc finger domain protein [Penicillium cf. griseofulvum]|uniref:C6 zinc finger domain protein n=1 Tax=Penicillium cf. griseofulvum TaxID=2972120 RepID=A0A9W9IWK3_9EURO|nr:C6 zinc finger domain protein [Penicillium cf. griseofulvum]KAJ5430279.1 C6 zinc finger domain protein [Penicillium cf. griseofulvum]
MPDVRVISDQIEPPMPLWSTHDPGIAPPSNTHETVRLINSKACDQCRSKKQRCERQRPVCSNCKRLNLVCEYSGRGKKPNQSTELIRRLRRAEDRINSLESSLSRIQPYLDRLDVEPVLINLPSVGELSSTGSTGIDLDDFEWPPSVPEVQQEFSEERDSIACLAVACAKTATAKYGGNNQTSGPLATLNSSLHHISELQTQAQNGTDTNVTVMRPPLSILQAMATTYFDTLNDSFPIFTRRNIEELIAVYDDPGNGSQDVAYSLCSNNIILLTLMAKVRRHLAQDVPAVMELELLKTFLENALGAFGNLEALLYPKIANLQALLSLSLVCQSMCLTDLARRSVQLTHSLWRLLDLQSGLQKSSPLPQIAVEHVNIFWCIFILETSIPMKASRRMPSYAVTETPLPLEEPGNRGSIHFLAAIHVARLRHNVLVTSTTSPPVHTAQGVAIHQLEELQSLQSALGIDAASPFAPHSTTNDFQLWTTLSCLITRLVINKAFPGSQSCDSVLSTARNAISILISIGMDNGENLDTQPLLPL